MKLKTNLYVMMASGLFCCLIAQFNVSAKTGATDPIPGTSKGTTNTGGAGGGGAAAGGGGSHKVSPTPTPVPTPAPAPAPAPQPIVTAPLTFSASGPVNGVIPVCTGDYRIDPYYPTLLDMTVNVNVSSLNVPDNTLLYINVVGANGTLYPYTSNAILIVGGAGSCSEHIFVTLGGSLVGVVITDASGTPVFAGN